jgi:hypothetical protein
MIAKDWKIKLCNGTWFLSHLSEHLKMCFSHPIFFKNHLHFNQEVLEYLLIKEKSIK